MVLRTEASVDREPLIRESLIREPSVREPSVRVFLNTKALN